MINNPWFKIYTDRFEDELNALAKFSIDFKVDEETLSQGILRIELAISPLNVNFDLKGISSPIELIAVFPEDYPYFRPEVFAYGLTLPRHQNLISKNLCLIPRSTESWEPEWTLANFLQEQLPIVLAKGTVTDLSTLAADSTEQAEPASEYYVSADYPVVFDGSPFINDSTVTHIAHLGKIVVGIPAEASLPSRLAVLEARDLTGEVKTSLPLTFFNEFSRQIEGDLFQLPERPLTGDAAKDLNLLREELQKQNHRIILSRKPIHLKNKIQLRGVIGLTFPEEKSPGKFGPGWLFIIVLTRKAIRPAGKGRTIEIDEEVAYYSRSVRIGADDMQVRVPKLIPLKQKKIAVIGLGALGAPAAIEFARNRIGELRILDYDTVEPATTIRWPLGLQASGLHKTIAIQKFITENYPDTNVIPLKYRLGGIKANGKGPINNELPGLEETINKLLDDVSLVFDASAEIGVHNYLYKEAKKRGLPYLLISATPGAWGGFVLRVIPGKTKGCWMCFQHGKTDESIPLPPADPEGDVQAPGCGDITFTGASFDLQNLSLAGVRMAIGTICNGVDGGYGDIEGDIALLKLVDEKGNPIMPSWKGIPLDRHPDCPYCAEE